MFVITADQRGSRTSEDLIPEALDAVAALAADGLVLAPERTAGDELQIAVRDARAALRIILHLTRMQTWSVGVGVGPVEHPLPTQVRAARGSAFLHARDAVDRAKRTPTRIALSGGSDSSDGPDAEAFVRLLIELRDRRTPEGWEVHDLLAEGRNQREAAAQLAITEGAVSLRARNAGLRAEEGAVPALERLLARLDAGPHPSA